MSIDTRLRAGLRAEVEQTGPVDVVDSWAEVMRRADRDSTRRRTRVAALAVAAVAAVAVVVAVVARPSDEVRPAPPVPTPSPSSSSPTGEPSAPSPVEGKWVAGPAPVQRILKHLANEGYGDVSAKVLRSFGTDPRPNQTFTLEMVIQGGQLVTGFGLESGPVNNVDFQSYEVRGGRIAFTPQGTVCESIFTWSVRRDLLRLHLLRDHCPDFEGAPDAAYSTALYTTLRFARSP
jgi:hypothetical protein